MENNFPQNTKTYVQRSNKWENPHGWVPKPVFLLFQQRILYFSLCRSYFYNDNSQWRFRCRRDWEDPYCTQPYPRMHRIDLECVFVFVFVWQNGMLNPELLWSGKQVILWAIQIKFDVNQYPLAHFLRISAHSSRPPHNRPSVGDNLCGLVSSTPVPVHEHLTIRMLGIAAPNQMTITEKSWTFYCDDVN